MVFTFQPPFWAGLSGYCAELGAAMICGELGLPTAVHDSHASYIDHWLRILKAERSAIFVAATKAEQAVTFLRTFATSISMAA